MLKYLLPPLLLALAACTSNPPTRDKAADAANAGVQTGPQAPDANAVANANKLIRTASQHIVAKAPAKALPLLDEAIGYYEKTFRQPGADVYSARSSFESLMYVGEAAQGKKPARVYGEEWSAAYFYKGYALVDLQRVAEAKIAFDAAIKLAPRNAQYLAERGHIDALERNWPASLATFKKAADATEFSPADVKLKETTRAMRGIAFAQVELKDLDAAEATHRRVLQLDPSDAVSAKELKYIRGLRARPVKAAAKK